MGHRRVGVPRGVAPSVDGGGQRVPSEEESVGPDRGNILTTYEGRDLPHE